MRTVTERDFRLPEFADADPKDYEFRSDGKIVRKDRFYRGFLAVVSAVGGNVRDFEIPEIVAKVEELAAAKETADFSKGYNIYQALVIRNDNTQRPFPNITGVIPTCPSQNTQYTVTKALTSRSNQLGI